MLKKVILNETQKVDKNAAEKWLNDNLICHPRKKDLDGQRSSEIDTQDLMQNTSMLYHTESVLEMQIFTTIAVILYSNKLGLSLDGSKPILIAFFIEHIFSYFCTLFRKWELEHYGQLDINGILHGPKETLLKFW